MGTNGIAREASSGIPLLSVSHYAKRYGDKTAVRDLSLEVDAGDIFGFVGHNGAGKTTLIRSVVGAQPVDGGHILVCGHDVSRDSIAAKSQMAYVPDNPDVYEFMTGIQYLSYIADMFRVGADERRERIGELAERLDIAGALNDAVGTYSHGMRQKLVLVGALLHDPRLLVLDEPFVGLDPLAAHELKGILHELAARGGAVFFSSHVLEVVETLCNKVAVIRKGELVASGSVEDVCGDESLERVFLELVDPAEKGAAGAHAGSGTQAGVPADKSAAGARMQATAGGDGVSVQQGAGSNRAGAAHSARSDRQGK